MTIGYLHVFHQLMLKQIKNLSANVYSNAGILLFCFITPVRHRSDCGRPIKRFFFPILFECFPLNPVPTPRRHVHPTWWPDSAQALGVEERPLGGGFGVTPAVLSTRGAELVFERLQTVHGSANFLRRILDISLSGLGGW